MIKSIEKLKVRIDQNLNRAEKSEALSEDVVKIEARISSLKQVCQSVTKKLDAGTSSTSGKQGNDGAAVEKRIRKTPEFALGQTFQENGRLYKAKHGPNEEAGGLSNFLLDSGQLLNDLGTSHVQYEIGVDKLVLLPLTNIVDEHVPQISKERKTLNSLLLEYDAAKGRLVNYRNKEGSTSSHGGTVESELREDRLSSDLAEIETKLNFARDSVELHMLQFLSKESDVGYTLMKYLELRKEYHENIAKQISEQMEHFQTLLNSPSVASPIYGCALDEHLKKHGGYVAFPIRICVCRMIQLDAIKEEGLFRVASSTLKIKRLAALFDTGEASDFVINEITDPHVFSGALKLYLRELPVPLLGQNYDRWMTDCVQKDERRREAIDSILSALPQSQRHNLHYILKFLQLVAKNSSINKMNPANLSIVMAPNLIWNCLVDANDPSSQHDLSQTSIVNDIVETLIDQVDYFFRGFGTGHMDFFKEVTLEKPKTMIKTNNSGSGVSENNGENNPRTPVPKPRQSKVPKGPPPPLAPRPSIIQKSNANNSTHL